MIRYSLFIIYGRNEMRKSHFMRIFLIMTLCVLLFIVSQSQTQQNLPKQELLNNIEILESVLDRIIVPEKGPVHVFGSATKGYYLMNYGVIFHVSSPFFSPGIILSNVGINLKVKRDNYIFVSEEEDEKETGDAKEDIEKLKQSIARFLSDWTSSLSDLKSEEKVTVIVDFNGFQSSFRTGLQPSIHQIKASVLFKEILNYRKGNLSKEAFKNKINYEELRSVDEDILILSNVIQTSLRYPDKGSLLDVSGDVNGFYFNGYGIIFFTDVSIGRSGYAEAFSIYTDALKKGKGRTITLKNIDEKIENSEKDIQKIEQKLIRLISDYGNNAKNVRPNEWFEIAVTFKGIPVNEKYSKGVFKVQKKTIDDYTQQKIEFDDFKKMVRITYY